MKLVTVFDLVSSRLQDQRLDQFADCVFEHYISSTCRCTQRLGHILIVWYNTTDKHQCLQVFSSPPSGYHKNRTNQISSNSSMGFKKLIVEYENSWGQKTPKEKRKTFWEKEDCMTRLLGIYASKQLTRVDFLHQTSFSMLPSKL